MTLIVLLKTKIGYYLVTEVTENDVADFELEVKYSFILHTTKEMWHRAAIDVTSICKW